MRVDMYHEVLSVMLEDSTLHRELKWLELFTDDNKASFQNEAQAVKAKIRSELLLKKKV